MKEKRFTRKIHQTGNSLTVGIPSEISEKLNLQKGEELEAIFVEGKDEIIYRKKEISYLPKGIDKEFLTVLEGVIDDYHEALLNLKDR
ncbi:AbrB/MazE/SpoVT family DNA-binding domain-containing protein [Paenisporosarcina cavernae]|nr:AbrB/MazE/SpoVT family DNA-binding domain-containing protein [Paenisporosarcina cavernae]